jgi:GcrA cell cycle regulator
MNWTGEKIATLASLWAMGWSATEIAMEFGCSRNAIIGKKTRLGLTRTADVTEAVQAAQSSHARGQMKMLRAQRNFGGKRPLADDAVDYPIAEKAAPPPGPVTIIDLAPHHCRYPLWTDASPTKLYCGEIRREGQAYCEAHRVITEGRGVAA